MGKSFGVITKTLVLLVLIAQIVKTEDKVGKKEQKPKKDLRDYTDADLERLYDQWEENDDEPLPEDELPEYMRPPKEGPPINFDNVGNMNPDDIMKMTKKGKTVMMFINLSGSPQRHESEELTSLWQGALRNNHIQAERYVIEDTRAIFLFHDGAQAWDAKTFLLEQDGIAEIQLEGQAFPGKGTKAKAKSKVEL
ncbi:LDLR chaperone MESD [Orchesella cincta]|uniref:LDLR chaperone MESD n=1 Tax=Orchesella cincta TaxID=48709 RepID=A0A1D2NCP9_ORCCI|nr:LDLR chaperone MESD [Orchesella cincta]